MWEKGAPCHHTSEVANNFPSFTLSLEHSKREGNKVAHCIARYASNISDFVVWMEDVPALVFVVVQADAANLF